MTSTRLKKLFFISTLFLLTYYSNSSASTETQAKQKIETEKVSIEEPKVQEIKTDNNKQNVDYLLELYANDKWGFMGKKFIDEWKYVNTINDSMTDELVLYELTLDYKKYNLQIDHSIYFIAETILLIFASFTLLDFLEKEAILTSENNSTVTFSLITTSVIIEIVVAMFHRKYYKKQLNKSKEKQKQLIANEQAKIASEKRQILLFLRSFLYQWTRYKKITPVELHSLFEKLNSEIKKIEYKDVLKIIPEIQDQIIKNNSKYRELYKKEIASRYSKKEPDPTPQSKTIFYPVFIPY